MIVLEARAAGAPVVCASTGGCPSWSSTGVMACSSIPGTPRSLRQGSNA